MPNYTFCEIVFGYSRWHIRDTEDRPPPYPKWRFNPKAVTLCGLNSVRDIDTPIGPYNLSRNTCAICARLYLRIMAEAKRHG